MDRVTYGDVYYCSGCGNLRFYHFSRIFLVCTYPARSGDFSTDLLLAAAFLPRHFKTGATSSLWAHPTRVPCDMPCVLGADWCLAMQCHDQITFSGSQTWRSSPSSPSRYGNFDIVLDHFLRPVLSPHTRRVIFSTKCARCSGASGACNPMLCPILGFRPTPSRPRSRSS